MSFSFQRLATQCIGRPDALILTGEIFSKNPKIHTTQSRVFCGPLRYIRTLLCRRHDPLLFAQRFHALFEEKIVRGQVLKDAQELTAALRVLDVALEVLRHTRKERGKKIGKNGEGQNDYKHVERLLIADIEEAASRLAIINQTSLLAQLVFQGDGAKRAAAHYTTHHKGYSVGNSLQYDEIVAYALHSGASLPHLKKILSSIPKYFVDYGKIPEDVRRKLLQLCFEDYDDDVASQLLQARISGLKELIEPFLMRDFCRMECTARILLRLYPDVISLFTIYQLEPVVRSAYRCAPHLLPVLSKYADIRPYGELEQQVLVRNHEDWEEFFEEPPVANGLQHEFSVTLFELTRSSAFLSSHPLEVAHFFPPVLPPAALYLSPKMLCHDQRLLKKYPEECLLQSFSQAFTYDSDHFTTACPRTLLPQELPKETLEDLIKIVQEAPFEEISKQQIVASVKQFAEVVQRQELRLGVPAQAEARKQFYDHIEKQLRCVAAKLKEKQDPYLTAGCLRELADAASHCGGRYATAVDNVYQRACFAVSGTAKERILQHIAQFRRICLESACAKLFGVSEHNVHGLHRALCDLGESLGIPGYEDFKFFDDVFATLEYDKNKVSDEFFQRYTPRKLVEYLHDAIRSDGEVKEAYLDLWKLLFDRSWLPLNAELEAMVTLLQTPEGLLRGASARTLLSNHDVILRQKGSSEDPILLAKRLSGKTENDIATIVRQYTFLQKSDTIEVDTEVLAQRIENKSSREIAKVLGMLKICTRQGGNRVERKNLMAEISATPDAQKLQEVLNRYMFTTIAKPQGSAELAKRLLPASLDERVAILSTFDIILRSEQNFLDAIEEHRAEQFFEYLFCDGELSKISVLLFLSSIHVLDYSEAVQAALTYGVVQQGGAALIDLTESH